MIYSRERVFHLVDRVLSEMEESGLSVTDHGRLRSKLVRILSDELRVLETIDQEVRTKIDRMSKPIAEGSGEWNTLYERFFEDSWRQRLKR